MNKIPSLDEKNQILWKRVLSVEARSGKTAQSMKPFFGLLVVTKGNFIKKALVWQQEVSSQDFGSLVLVSHEDGSGLNYDEYVFFLKEIWNCDIMVCGDQRVCHSGIYA